MPPLWEYSPAFSNPVGGPGGSWGETDEKEEYHPLWAYAYLELKKAPAVSRGRDGKLAYYQIDHKWGKPVIVPAEVVTYIQDVLTGGTKAEPLAEEHVEPEKGDAQ